jgi:hypothetical protein
VTEILQGQQDLQHGFLHLFAFVVNRELEKFEELGQEQAHLVIIIVDEAQNSEECCSTNLFYVVLVADQITENIANLLLHLLCQKPAC